MQKKGITPSAIFSNASAQVFNQFEDGSILERAHQIYKEKTFLERFKPHYKAANIASYLFQGLSALFAFTFGQRLVAGVLPQFGETAVLVLSCLVAGTLLAGIEVFKRLCLGSFVVSFIQSRASQSGVSVSWASLAINIFLIGVAVYTSTQGAKEFTQRQTDKSEQIRGRYSVVSDSVAAALQKQVDSEKKALADFKRSVSWKGKINMDDKSTSFTIASYNRRLEKAQAEKEKALGSLDAGLQSDLSDNAAKTAKDSGNMFWVSLLVELAGLLCIGYVYLYLARVFIEQGAQAGPGQQPDPTDRRENDYLQHLSRTIEDLAQTLHENRQPAAAPVAAASAPIGFRRYDSPAVGDIPADGRLSQPLPVADTGAVSNAETDSILERYLSPLQNQAGGTGFSFAELQGFLRKYANVVKCIEAGLSNKQVAKQCGVSETTVHNVKRCLRNLGNAKVNME